MVEWNQILCKRGYSIEEPDDAVVNFAALLRKKSKEMRILDLGCGGGRHQIYMARQGFETHGIDISKTGLKLTKDRLEKQRLAGHMVKCDMHFLPYVDFCFDAVVCFQTIYHQGLSGIQGTVSEVHRILRKEGLILVNFLSNRTYSYAIGAEVEGGTFVREEGAEKGVLHHFSDKEEIEQLFKRFKIVSLRLHEKEVEGALQSRWILIAKT
ncbi:MAG: class I SAM-dependent methyltransferase [Candidatus Bathyarchaeota archaeon]|nr:class I SAM-dependent methyltransferase [Candidatus Bathyarchaeota archaeon]MDH5787400.1 class I SAM-dependent methyltransferase [Candidatus Bathyarchaeota archaeon]